MRTLTNVPGIPTLDACQVNNVFDVYYRVSVLPHAYMAYPAVHLTAAKWHSNAAHSLLVHSLLPERLSFHRQTLGETSIRMASSETDRAENPDPAPWPGSVCVTLESTADMCVAAQAVELAAVCTTCPLLRPESCHLLMLAAVAVTMAMAMAVAMTITMAMAMVVVAAEELGSTTSQNCNLAWVSSGIL